MSEKVKEIIIDGCVNTEENPISVEDFNDKFLKWIESNNWYFSGYTQPARKDKNYI